MSAECYPISVLPHLQRIFQEFTELRTAPKDAPVRQFYPSSPFDPAWKQGTSPALQPDRTELVRVLRLQNEDWGCGEVTHANLDKLAAGARAVVTGQQVGLFGGPLLTLMKAATAIRKAQVASESGVPHVPIFWMATEDHDLDEVNQAAFLARDGVEVLRSQFPNHGTREVGSLPLGEAILPVVERAEELLGFAPVADLLRACYAPSETLASSFAKLITALFREYGLIVIDANRREYHSMGSPVLRYAIAHADALHDALLQNADQLVAAGFHAQVLIAESSSLLFVVDEQGNRLPLRRVPKQDGSREWKAGARVYAQDELLALLEGEPERLSPNALLRPVFQDALLPTSAYVGGPAEIAYFAQCRVLFEQILGAMAPVLPRLSATLVDAPVREVMEQHELSLRDALQPAGDLLQKLGARAIPIEGKRAIAAAGNALDDELRTVEQWMGAMDESLGRSAGIAANKMRYQMNRLRRLAANWQVQKETHLAKHAKAVSDLLYPQGHPQERYLSGVALLARTELDVPRLLVENAEQDCPGHRVFDI